MRPDPDLAPFTCLTGIVPTIRRHDAGTVLFRQGDTPLGLFWLAQGSVRLLRVTSEGARVAMHTARSGDTFAEASLFSDRYHCDAVAERSSEVWLYPKTELAARLQGSGEDLWRFAAELARQVQGLRTRLEMRQIRSAPERVLQALRLRCDGAGTWRPEAPLREFAEEIGLTHEALYRALATLQRRGSIERREGANTLRC